MSSEHLCLSVWVRFDRAQPMWQCNAVLSMPTVCFCLSVHAICCGHISFLPLRSLLTVMGLLQTYSYASHFMLAKSYAKSFQLILPFSIKFPFRAKFFNHSKYTDQKAPVEMSSKVDAMTN